MSQTNPEETSDVQVKAMDKPQAKNADEDQLSKAAPIEALELSDPAILAVSHHQSVRHRYTRDELLVLRDVPLSQARHEFLDPAFDNSNGVWDPERWHCERKRSETPVENGSNSELADNHRRRPGDPRERIRKEQDGIVLSPQRRSFNSGCFVPVRGQVPPRNRAHSPLGKTEATHIVHRELPPGTRRIGSGRIVRDWDYPDKNEVDNGFGFRREHRDSERDERFERRSFGRDFDMSRDKEKERHIGRNGRYNDRRRVDNREEEPEWFSSGPMSQSDTIELRGFDESEKAALKKKPSAASKKRANKERAITKISEMQPVEEKKESANTKSSGATRSTPTPQDGMAPSGQPQSPNKDHGGGGDASESKPVEATTNVIAAEQALNFTEDFWKLPELTNGLGGDGDHAAESRFSRFFKNRESPVKTAESRRSSIHDDHHLIKNLLNEIAEPTVSIPGDAESYFAPISPAANTGGTIGSQPGPQAGSKPMNIMEVLQRGKQQPLPADMPPSMKNAGNIMSLEELEAHMRQGGAGDHSSSVVTQKSAQLKQEDDTVAFKRFLAQVSGGHALPATNGPIPHKSQPLTLMEMLSHSQKQDELRMASAHMMGAGSPNQPPPQVPNDLAMKLNLVQQQQQRIEMLSKIMNANNAHRQQLRASPLPEFSLAQSRELLNRPEAQAILQGLKRGDITPQHLYQQLANPALQPRHRELLLTILKLYGSGGLGPSPRVLSPVPPLPLFQQQQQQQLRVSPLPPNATSPNTLTVPGEPMHQRIPSPRELQVHTQNILQRALIKKKLEEQQENYRKKQEMQQRGQSPNSGVSPAKSVSSPTPLAFTPTSVLRKMTADKDEGKEGNKSDGHGKVPQGRAVTGIRPQNQPQQLPTQWNSQYSIKQPAAGRPIVKASANYQQQQQSSQQDQQQQFYQQRLYNQQQLQRKAAQQYSSGAPLTSSNSQYPQQYSSNQFQQLTQQQLRAQHQQQHVRVPQQQPQQQSPFSQHHQQNQWHQLLNSQQQTYDNRSSHLGRGGLDGGDLSPTSNQLARWFSPDLLERARAGKLPNMPTASLAQHALSLEEIERQTAPPVVHN